jgi:ABC-type ATPase involved in cell division
MTLDIMKIFTDLHQSGATIVFATQFTGLVKRFPYRIIQILDGKILEGRKPGVDQGQVAKEGE